MHIFSWQMDVLHQLRNSNPDGNWWIKEDGCDLKECLQESKRKEWFGDIDVGDGKQQEMRTDYLNRLKSTDTLHTSMDDIQAGLTRDYTFLKACLTKSSLKYKKALQGKNTSEDKLMRLNWDVVELSALMSQCDGFQSELHALKHAANSPQHKHLAGNTSANLKTYFRNIYRKYREPGATHILVFMISEESRTQKPYALPVLAVLYNSLTDAKVRALSEEIKEEMREIGMTPIRQGIV
jgi:hypothetical protein